MHDWLVFQLSGITTKPVDFDMNKMDPLYVENIVSSWYKK